MRTRVDRTLPVANRIQRARLFVPQAARYSRFENERGRRRRGFVRRPDRFATLWRGARPGRWPSVSPPRRALRGRGCSTAFATLCALAIAADARRSRTWPGFAGTSCFTASATRRRWERSRSRSSSAPWPSRTTSRSEEHTSELQSLAYLVCRLLLEKKKNQQKLAVCR